MEHSNWNIVGIVLAFYAGLWSYAGWDVLNYGTTEVRNPRRQVLNILVNIYEAEYFSRNMPLSLITGITTVSLIYTAINVAYFAVMSVDEVKGTDAIAAVKKITLFFFHFF